MFAGSRLLLPVSTNFITLLLFFNKYVEVLFFSQEKQSQTIQFQDKKQHLTEKTPLQ